MCVRLRACSCAGVAVKRQAELFFPAEFADDFPVSLQISDKYGLVRGVGGLLEDQRHTRALTHMRAL